MDSYHVLFDLIGRLARRRYQFAERYYASLGLNHTEARLLRILDQQGGAMPQDELSGLLQVDRSNAGRALKRLEGLGHIQRAKDGEDLRRFNASLTAKGRRLAAEINKLRREMIQVFFRELKEKDAAMAAKLLGRVMEDE